jgi:hypothetical protein
MADTLGIRPVDLSIDRAYTQSLVGGIQALGAQLRGDLQTIQTNKQLQSFAGQLQGINPQSLDFAPQMVNAISSNPLAAQSQAGRSAIGMLGNAHEAYLREQADIRNFNQQIDLFGRQQGALDKRDERNFSQQKERDDEAERRRIAQEERELGRPKISNSPYGTAITDQRTGETKYNPNPYYQGRGGTSRDYAHEAQGQALRKSAEAARREFAKAEAVMTEANAEIIAADAINESTDDARKNRELLRTKAKEYRTLADKRRIEMEELERRVQSHYGPSTQAPAAPQPSIPAAPPTGNPVNSLDLPVMGPPPSFTMGMTDAIPGLGAEPSLFPAAPAAAPVVAAPQTLRYIPGKGLVR